MSGIAAPPRGMSATCLAQEVSDIADRYDMSDHSTGIGKCKFGTTLHNALPGPLYVLGLPGHGAHQQPGREGLAGAGSSTARSGACCATCGGRMFGIILTCTYT